MGPSTALPVVNRASYFRADAPALLHSIAAAIGQGCEVGQPLSEAHLAVRAWAKLLADVPNGGFTQFFYNLRGDHGVEPLCNLLTSLDHQKLADVLRRAADLYRADASRFQTDNPWDDLFGKMPAFDELDRAYGSGGTVKATEAIAKWCREHLNELVIGDDGNTIDRSFTGTVEVRRSDGSLAESLEVRNGKAHGAHREFFVDGSIREATFYQSGKKSGDHWPDGRLRRREFTRRGRRTIEWYHPSGQVQKRMVLAKDGPPEPTRLYHENGQLAEEASRHDFTDVGPWLKFFPDGSPQLQAEFDAQGELIVHNAWDADGNKTVMDGTGVFADDGRRITLEHRLFFEHPWQTKRRLRGGRPHGRCEQYNRGVLWRVDQYVDGKLHGESTTYWDNGRVRSITRYEDDVAVDAEDAAREFPKFDRPVPMVLLAVEANEPLYTAWRHRPVDEFPAAVNMDEIRGQLPVPQFLRDVYERNLSGQTESRYEDWNCFEDGINYTLDIDEAGTVTEARATSSRVYSGGSWELYKPLLRQLRFRPGRLRGRAVPCKVAATVTHTFVEGNPA